MLQFLAHMCSHKLSVHNVHAKLDCFKITNGNLSHMHRTNYLVQVTLVIKIPVLFNLYIEERLQKYMVIV